MAEIIQHPSPNYGPRRENARPSLVVIHYTAMTSAQAALDTLCNPKTEVSAHYLIGADGRVWQLVAEADRAWHAGAGQWGDITDVNSHSIGIELDNKGDHPFAEPQMAALENLLSDVLKRWDIQPKGVIAHSDFAPHRKIDPGLRFDWCRLAKQGLALWPDRATASDDWEKSAAKFGYSVKKMHGCDAPKDVCFQAFRMRFRPWYHGPEDAEDRRIMARLAAQSGF